MHKLVLLRHGLSEWNLQNCFTGWHDVDLADAGIAESCKAGQALRDAGFQVERVAGYGRKRHMTVAKFEAASE